MNILSIETSCDETAISLLKFEQNNSEAVRCTILGNALYSQADKHAEYGGVYPDLAKREHSKNLTPLLGQVLAQAEYKSGSVELPDTKKERIGEILQREPELKQSLLDCFDENTKVPVIDAVAVTVGPGLEPALWVGINFARALSVMWDVPLLPVNHMEGHAMSVLLSDELDLTPPATFPLRNIEFPALALLVSGGHTELVIVKDWLEYEKIGQTRDDAVGEAFDKVARMMDLGYPGGPEISRLAQQARDESQNTEGEEFTLPRPMIDSDDLDFSFSGLKTAVMYKLRKRDELSDNEKRELACEFEEAVTDVLITKMKKALKIHKPKTLILGGGVAANRFLRARLNQLASDEDITLLLPHQKITGDNSIMIGLAAYIMQDKGEDGVMIYADDTDKLKAQGRFSL